MVRILKWLSTAMVVALWVVACGDVPRGVFSRSSSGGDGGSGGIASQSSTGMGGSTASASSGSGSSGAPMCGPGGTPCQSFSECCSGTCANNVCTECFTDGEVCGGVADSCCSGHTCYQFGTSWKCGDCSADALPCQTSDDCCSTVCSQGQCAALNCGTQQSCGSYCAELDSDPTNCGLCGRTCGPAETCCGGACVDTQLSDLNCGTCGFACSGFDDCINGQCATSPCCEVAVNVGPGASPPTKFSKYIAWAHVPDCDMLVKGAEIFSTHGYLYLMTDGQGAPDATLAMEGITVSQFPAWDYVPIVPPVQLVKGNQYWVVQLGDGQTTISAANVGQGIPYKTSASAALPPNHPTGPWFDGGTAPLMFKLIGSCSP